MAISPILEQRDSREILKTLLYTKKTVKELNEYFLTKKNLNISTATLYRRVKELYLAGFLEKLDTGSYIASDHGKMAYNELFNSNKQLTKIKENTAEYIRQLTGKESLILEKLRKRQYYTRSMMDEISISPNNLIQILDNLLQLQLIEVIEKPRKKPGRPKKIYRITDRGKLILQQIEEIKRKIGKR